MCRLLFFQQSKTNLKQNEIHKTYGGFWRNEWVVGTRAYTHKMKAQNLTYM